MIALDTYVLVRLLTEDDPAQFQVARALMETPRQWLPKTVLLELEWVLRYSYDFPPERILTAFRLLLGYPSLHVEDRRAVLGALRGYAAGMDFGDALHLASSATAASFATFDRRVVRGAAAAKLEPPVELLR